MTPAPIVSVSGTTPWRCANVHRAAVPTMLSDEELRYLTWLGAAAWQGRGAILEIGPWLGGSTRALASGVRQSSHARDGVLTSVDSFIWKHFMNERSGLSLAEGESFLPCFRKNMEEFGKMVVAVQAVLPDDPMENDPDARAVRSTLAPESALFHWDASRPVEMLFVDGAKSYHGLKYLLAEIAGSLVPGHSLLIFQDYKYWGAYWVPLLAEMLADSLAPLHVLRHNTVTFLLQRPLRRADVAALPDLSQLAANDGLALLERAARRLEALGDAGGGAITRVAQVRFLIHKDKPAEALQAFRVAEAGWPASEAGSNLERCRRWLEERLNHPVPKTWSRRIKRLWSKAHRAAFARRQSH